MRVHKNSIRILICIITVISCGLIEESIAQTIYDKRVVNSPNVDSKFKKGIHYFKAGDYAAAETIFAGLVSYAPPHQRITISSLMYGKVLFELGKYKQCIGHLRKFNRAYPQSRYIENSHYTIASTYYMLGNYVAAVRDFLWLVDYAKDPKPASKSKMIAIQLIDSFLSSADIETLVAEIPAEKAAGILAISLAKKQAAAGFSNRAINIIIDYMNSFPQSEYIKKLEKYITKAKVRSSSGHGHGLKIGVILPLTGGYAEDGKNILKGIKYALKKSSAASGLNIQLAIRDSESNIVTAIKAAQKLVADESVIAIIGELESSVTAAIANVIDYNKIPLISPVASQFGIASIGKYIFQANCDLNERGKQLAIYAMKELGLSTFATLGPADEYGKGMIDGFTSTVDKLGGTIIAQKWFYEGTVNLSRQMRSIRALGFKQMAEDTVWNRSKYILLARADYDTSIIPITSIDALFCPVYTNDIKYIGPQCAAFNIRTQLLGGDYWHDMEVLRSNRSYVNGVIFTSDYYVSDDDAEFRRLRTDFRKTMKTDLGRFQVYGYDTMCLILSTIKKGNISTRSRLREELETIYKFEGVKGLISLRGNQRVNTEINIIEFSNGHLTKAK